MKLFALLSIALLFGHVLLAQPIKDPNYFSIFGGRNISGFENLSCKDIVATAGKSMLENSQKYLLDKDVTPEKCQKEAKRFGRQLVGLFSDSDCSKEMSFVVKKLNEENEVLRKILRIRMAIYDSQYLFSNPDKNLKSWLPPEINCSNGLKKNTFIKLGTGGRPVNPENGKRDTDIELIEKLEGRCQVIEPMIGSAVRSFSDIAAKYYLVGNGSGKKRDQILEDRKVCQDVIDKYALEIAASKVPRQVEKPAEKRQSSCVEFDPSMCNKNLNVAGIVVNSCLVALYEYCNYGDGRTKSNNSNSSDNTGRAK